VRREGTEFALLQRHVFALRYGDGAVGEEVLHQALLQFPERGDDAFRRLFRPLHRPQHVGNGALFGERREGDAEVFNNTFVYIFLSTLNIILGQPTRIEL